MVEGGENDSFDTSIIHADEEPDIILSSGPSQMSSGGQMSIGSQDSIQDFFTKADEERVILRSPFQPTVPAARQTPRRDNSHRSPDPEFFMPTVEVAGSRRSSGRSSRTIRPVGRDDDQQGGYELRRRIGQRHASEVDGGSPISRRANKGRVYYDSEDDGESRRGLKDGLASSLPGALLNVLGWLVGVVGMAFRFAQRPLALLLSIYFFFGGLIIVQNMVTQSLFVSLSPICRIPGVSYLDLAFCPRPSDPPIVPESGQAAGRQVEFDELMGVQSQFEQVLERSASGVSLPLEMKRSESSIRDLRTMVRYSELTARDELRAAKFNTHVGSAVDSVISINKWTARYLDGFADGDPKQDLRDAGAGGALLADWASWVFYPFQPATPITFDERALIDKYIEHTSLVSDRISALILEAQAVLRHLTKAEDHLSLIYEIVTRSSQSVESRRDQILWTLWTLVGANSRRLQGLNAQLSLLRQVDTQRSAAVAQVSGLIVDLERIEAGLGDLRDRVAEPGIARRAGSPGGAPGSPRIHVPLSVHIETIDRGVERLEAARNRIRAAENDKIREALARRRQGG
ncbi:unnamed protein product [Parascedosporium putredinis]|uniref:Uncharacterized protein n=1 Tax=Parascedosporium putredinis TaxID=1442378 RepID=A0A9P1H9X8_9PEZI|nr:unnamed protein product [Parascedosporium putredinis]CAI8002121.1 unnamed protein product [Parascedosporium putredinis]